MMAFGRDFDDRRCRRRPIPPQEPITAERPVINI